MSDNVGSENVVGRKLCYVRVMELKIKFDI
jgi:hypothetical protein